MLKLTVYYLGVTSGHVTRILSYLIFASGKTTFLILIIFILFYLLQRLFSLLSVFARCCKMATLTPQQSSVIVSIWNVLLIVDHLFFSAPNLVFVSSSIFRTLLVTQTVQAFIKWHKMTFFNENNSWLFLNFFFSAQMLMKSRLQGATRGHGLLKKKADALQMRFRLILGKIIEVTPN